MTPIERAARMDEILLLIQNNPATSLAVELAGELRQLTDEEIAATNSCVDFVVESQWSHHESTGWVAEHVFTAFDHARSYVANRLRTSDKNWRIARRVTSEIVLETFTGGRVRSTLIPHPVPSTES